MDVRMLCVTDTLMNMDIYVLKRGVSGPPQKEFGEKVKIVKSAKWVCQGTTSEMLFFVYKFKMRLSRD